MLSIRAGMVLLVAALAGPVCGYAAEPPGAGNKPAQGYAQAQSLVDEAATFLRQAGPDQAFAAFNDPNGKWVRGDLYIFAFDQKGTYRATGFQPERTGTNAWELTDVSGFKVVQAIIAKSQRNGSGLVEYLWKNPLSNRIEMKTSYVLKVDDFVIGAGFYPR